MLDVQSIFVLIIFIYVSFALLILRYARNAKNIKKVGISPKKEVVVESKSNENEMVREILEKEAVQEKCPICKRMIRKVKTKNDKLKCPVCGFIFG